jgi:hypothetical protein
VYSFIVPRKKVTLDTFTYMWILFILLTSILLIGIGLYVESENNKFYIYKSEIKSKIEQNREKKIVLKKEIQYFKKIYREYKSTDNSNKSLKNAIKNLLSFIPDQIIINKMVLDKYEVKLYGYIDSPKTYKLLLEPPLKSIFDTTKVGFTKVEDGKYLFSSYNKIKRVKNEKK